MVTITKNLPEDIVGFKYDEHVTKEDYENVLFPLFKTALEKSKDLKVLCEVADSFKDFNLGAIKDDMEIWLKYYTDWKKIAFVSDHEWMVHMVKAFKILIPAKIKIFENKDRIKAINWLEEN